MKKFIGKLKCRVLLWLLDDICNKSNPKFDGRRLFCTNCSCFKFDEFLFDDICPCAIADVMGQAYKVWRMNNG